MQSSMSNFAVSVVALGLLAWLSAADAFSANPVVVPAPLKGRLSSLALSGAASDTTETILSLSLEKPLGMVLEEVEEGAPRGVFVLELAEDGSAAASPEKDAIVGSKLASVMGEDVTTITFDEVMDKIINAPSLVDLELVTASSGSSKGDESGVADDDEEEEEAAGFSLGTAITVTVQRDGEPDLVIDAKVGDNLRSTLIENQVEVYRGFKAKIGNCGGGGQCGFCAVEFIDSEGWAPRSDYEANKIKNKPNSRLSCLNNIQGPVTIKM